MPSINNHPDYGEEAVRLQYTKDCFEKFIKTVGENRVVYKKEIRQAFIDLDYLDSSQSYITILVNAKLLDVNKEDMDKVIRAKERPYFSRIDFQEEDSNDFNKYYIGKLSLQQEDHEPLIIDWRAPVASIYYDGRLGEVSYRTDTGTVNGQLSLKRQYTINHGQLENFFDVDIATHDDFLQSHLGARADHRLKDIVATIQAEQNKIIRADLENPLIVQGVAGSGKTTIALHRIAYLIYTYEQSFDPDNFMIIAPNTLFLNYISDVLPELGVERVKQTTFVDLCFELLGERYKLIKPEEKLITLLKGDKTGTPTERQMIKWLAAFKGSMEFKETIDRYLADIEKMMLPQEDLVLEGYCIVGSEDVARLFTVEHRHLPFYQRLKQLQKNLSMKLKLTQKDIIEKLSAHYEKKINLLRSTMEEIEHEHTDDTELACAEEKEQIRVRIVALIDEKEAKLASVNRSSRTLVAKYLAKFPKKDSFTHYKQLLTDPELLRKFLPDRVDNSQIQYMVSEASKHFSKKKVELEDLVALLYFKARLEGFGENMKINNVIIDEAQDFSVFQFYVVKYILETNNFTIFGDISQGIYSFRGINDWKDVQEKVFNDGCSYLELKQSYRTTIEIMNLANKVIQMGTEGKVVLAEPVVRHGESPRLARFTMQERLLKSVAKTITNLRREG